ncbi:phosphatase PAP2 family protein [Jeotgalibacillus proteolyticus]|uniref:phosphatase PAP2 family protein n=1 Tax=Jeotgalibacillus proteolyticus TaxID=2082395 RepID=UPI003CEDE7C6
MKKVFFPLGVVTLLAALLLIGEIRSSSIIWIDEAGSRFFGSKDVFLLFEFLGSEWFLGSLSILAVLYLWFKHKNYFAMVIVLLAVAGGNVLSKVLKTWMERDRPVSGGIEETFSFPSGHAMVSLIAAVVIVYLVSAESLSRSKAAAAYSTGILFSILAGFSRLPEQAHYFSDVIGGWLIGYTYAVSCLLLYEWLLKKKQ